MWAAYSEVTDRPWTTRKSFYVPLLLGRGRSAARRLGIRPAFDRLQIANITRYDVLAPRQRDSRYAEARVHLNRVHAGSGDGEKHTIGADRCNETADRQANRLSRCPLPQCRARCCSYHGVRVAMRVAFDEVVAHAEVIHAHVRKVITVAFAGRMVVLDGNLCA